MILPRIYNRNGLCLTLIVTLAIGSGATRTGNAARGELELQAVDGAGEPTAVRIQLRNSRGRPVFAPRLPRVGDAFVFDGTVVLNLSPGLYTFRVDKGPEFRDRTGHFEIKSGAADNHQIEMRRYVDMQSEGWWSGDLAVKQPIRQMPLLMLAEDLHLANVLTWSNRNRAGSPQWPTDAAVRPVGRNRLFHVTGGRDQRAGSDVIYGLASEPFELAPSVGEYPSPFEPLKDKRFAGHIHLNRIDCWDLPVWVASGRLQSVGLLHPGLQSDRSVDEAVGRPRDRVLFPDPEGVGRWAQQIYFRLLESGIRIPPASASGSGTNANPVGYNRVYVHCGNEFSAKRWWEGLQRGRVVLTNGPLLRPRANGHLPGHVFRANSGAPLQLEIEAQLGTRQKIDYFEVIKNGRPEAQVRLDEWAAQGGRLPPVTFESSGWMLVRVVARDEKAYRCACSGPFYVEFDDRPRVSRQAAEFFLDWVYQRAKGLELSDTGPRAAVMKYHRAARDYWKARVENATAD